MAAPEAERRVHAQQAPRFGARTAQQLRQFIHLAKNAARVRQIDLAFRGETHAARRAIDERDAGPRFHLRKMLADGRRGDAQLARRRGQAAAPREHGEKREVRRLNRGLYRAAHFRTGLLTCS
jgi:hypothetical protein